MLYSDYLRTTCFVIYLVLTSLKLITSTLTKAFIKILHLLCITNVILVHTTIVSQERSNSN